MSWPANIAGSNLSGKSDWKKLRDKCGSASTLKEFRRLVSNIIGETHSL